MGNDLGNNFGTICNIYLYTENTVTLLKIISFFGSIVHQKNFAQCFGINLGQFWEQYWDNFRNNIGDNQSKKLVDKFGDDFRDILEVNVVDNLGEILGTILKKK